jgi:hypothetical protein
MPTKKYTGGKRRHKTRRLRGGTDSSSWIRHPFYNKTHAKFRTWEQWFAKFRKWYNSWFNKGGKEFMETGNAPPKVIDEAREKVKELGITGNDANIQDGLNVIVRMDPAGPPPSGKIHGNSGPFSASTSTSPSGSRSTSQSESTSTSLSGSRSTSQSESTSTSPSGSRSSTSPPGSPNHQMNVRIVSRKNTSPDNRFELPRNNHNSRRNAAGEPTQNVGQPGYNPGTTRLTAYNHESHKVVTNSPRKSVPVSPDAYDKDYMKPRGIRKYTESKLRQLTPQTILSFLNKHLEADGKQKISKTGATRDKLMQLLQENGYIKY